MKKKSKYIIIFTVIAIAIVMSCNKTKSESNIDTTIAGKVSVLVDETVLPIIEDQVQVFENTYDAKVTLIPQSENECMIALGNINKPKIAILSRELNKQEIAYFKSKNLIPRQTIFATDAIALIGNNRMNDTLIDLNEIINFVNSKSSKIKGLVFDNPNSSTVRYFKELSKVAALPERGVFSFKSNEEVIKYVAENDGMIGVVGENWLSQPNAGVEKNLNKVKVLSVKGIDDNNYYYPSQDAIASKKYPLARDLYIINCQGYEGLGIGLSSFFAGEIGQRIILKSGLVPVRTPGRKIRIRNQIEKK